MWSSGSPSDGQGKRKRLEVSNFAQTCNLLSRYVKEKGSLRDLNLEIGGKVESLEALVKPGSSLAAPSSANSGSVTNSGKSAHSSLENPIIVEEDASNRAIRCSYHNKKVSSVVGQKDTRGTTRRVGELWPLSSLHCSFMIFSIHLMWTQQIFLVLSVSCRSEVCVEDLISSSFSH